MVTPTKPIDRDTRAAWTVRENRSRPMLSVPNSHTAPGASAPNR